MVIKSLFKRNVLGWINFNKDSIKRCYCGYKTTEFNHAGEREDDYKIYWCFFGFTGYFPLKNRGS